MGIMDERLIQSQIVPHIESKKGIFEYSFLKINLG